MHYEKKKRIRAQRMEDSQTTLLPFNDMQFFFIPKVDPQIVDHSRHVI